MQTKDIFISHNSLVDTYIRKYKYPFEVLPNIEKIITEIGNTLDSNYNKISNNIWINKTAEIDETTFIEGPCIIDEYAKVKANAYIRKNVIIGKHTQIGNACELKNSILYDNVTIAHFNYVGDSIIGSYSHLADGAIISNLRLDKKEVIIKTQTEAIKTNLIKVGAFLGDKVEVGCNTVINPGSIILSNSIIYPLVSLKGFIPENSIIKKSN